MQSPVANKKPMRRITLEDGLIAFECSESEGVFLPVTSYLQWLSKQPERLPQLPDGANSDEIVFEEAGTAKICPESGMIMQRYRVGHGFNFYIDRSPNGSLWFDKGEWEALRERQFHDELHFIFTSPWQDKIRSEEKEQMQRELLIAKLGESLVGKLDDLRSELDDHDQREFALAYLYS